MDQLICIPQYNFSCNTLVKEKNRITIFILNGKQPPSTTRRKTAKMQNICNTIFIDRE